MPGKSWSDLFREGPEALRSSVPLDVSKVWTPHPGPQTQFMQSTAYELLYGGAAGGGKTDALLYGPLDELHLPTSRVLFLRESYPELREVMDRALKTFPYFGATWNEQRKRWTFPAGGTYEFGFVKTYADVLQYQGQEYTTICFDEIGKCSSEKIWTYLMSRNRSTDPRIRTRMRASANPGGAGHAWNKRRFIQRCPWTGEPIVADAGLTRAFIPAKLSDNPSLDLGDPTYRMKLHLLPEITRRQLEDGDWSAGEGLALSELNREIHLIEPFLVPDRWYQWGAYDWGFNHPFMFGHFAADPDGNAYLINTVTGRRLLPNEQANVVKELLPTHLMRKIHAGRDCWNEQRSRGENTRSICDQFRENGLTLHPANISRISGLNNMRDYVHYDPKDVAHCPPRFYIVRTATNELVYDCLESMVEDPKRPEDALKVDADDLGEGGDDAYDMVRYGLAARPLKGKAEEEGGEFTAFGQEALKGDLENRRVLKRRARQQSEAESEFDTFEGL